MYRRLHHQQVAVGMQHGFSGGNGWLVRHLAEVVNLRPDAIGGGSLQRAAVSIQDPSTGEALPPRIRAHLLKMGTQPIKHRRPWPGRKLQPACANAIARGA